MYAELHAHSYYSLLDGASSPRELAARASELGMPALALTDHDALYGAVEFAIAATEHGLRPIFGAEMTLASGHHLTLLVRNQIGWHNLCWLITQARHNAPKGESKLPRHLLEDHTDGLIALSGCRHGEVAASIIEGDELGALSIAKTYRDWFGPENFWIELQQHYLPGDRRITGRLVALAEHLRVGYVATNNVHYAMRDGHRLQDVLVGIRNLETLEDCRDLRPNSEYYLKSADEMCALFADFPNAVTNSLSITERCDFRLSYGLQDLPQYPTADSIALLRALCEELLQRRYADCIDMARAQLEHELAIIERGGLANYFLVVWDVVRFARENGIRCQGRGSAANSLAAYLLNISPVDPIAHELVFERFLSAERQVAPDIDIDFQANRREEVIQYVYERYGHSHAAMACTFITFRKRSAMRDVGKVLGLPPEVMAQGLKILDDDEAELEHPWDQVLDLCQQIHGLPRHLGIHNGGMILTRDALSHYMPTEPATMQDRYVVQWDKDSLEESGLIKIDILGLGMLSLIAEALDHIKAQTGTRPDFDQMSFDDDAIFEMISAADTMGVFQVESRAQAQMLPRFRPRSFNDIIIAISLIRPGPIQGDMVHPYLRRRLGQEKVNYYHESLKPALQETLGVILFQEQVLKVARDLAGFSPGQGELLRRALGAKNASAAIEKFHDEFIAGALARNVSPEIAEDVFNRLRAFGAYSFAKSHAAAFAVLVYQSAWIKYYHPAAFFTALLNNQPMGFWSPAVIVSEARRLGVDFLSVDVNLSSEKCRIEGAAIRLGFNYVKGFGDAQSERVISARGGVPFTDLKDFCRRTQLPRRLIENVIMAGGFDTWDTDRRAMIWQLGRLNYAPDMLDLDFHDEPIDLAPLTIPEQMIHEFDTLGLSLGVHPIVLYRPQLVADNILSSRDIESAEGRVRVAGLVVVHQAPPTAKGFHFLTLEDEFGFLNVIVKPNVHKHYKRFIHTTAMMIVEGVLQREGAVINVVAGRFKPIT